MSDSDEDALERQVFGRKKYYSLVLNMPNLTSATGSWIVRFAELKQSDNKIAIAAPVAVSKVDPAYPADAMRDNVEGTVTLYAVIHTDGTVSGIKILNSVDPRRGRGRRARAVALGLSPRHQGRRSGGVGSGGDDSVPEAPRAVDTRHPAIAKG